MEHLTAATLLNSLSVMRHDADLAGLVGELDTVRNRVKELDERLERLERLLDKEAADQLYR